MLYIFISTAISLVWAFALSAFFSFFAVFGIAFGSSVILLTNIDLFINNAERSPLLKWLRLSFTDEGDDFNFLFWKLFGASFIIAGIPLALWLAATAVLFLIINPLSYFLHNSEENKHHKFSFLSILILILLFLFVVGIILLISPATIYSIIHYGWIIGIYIGVTAILLTCFGVMGKRYEITGKTTAALCVNAALLIPIMIIGICVSMNSIYTISTPDDMIMFANTPTNQKTAFILQNDIDFSGEDVSGWFGRKEFNGVFDGRGHSLSNISFDGKIKTIPNRDSSGCNSSDFLATGFILENNGIIRNLHLINCNITFSKNTGGGYKAYGIFVGRNNNRIENCSIQSCRIVVNSSNRYDTPSVEVLNAVGAEGYRATTDVEIIQNPDEND